MLTAVLMLSLAILASAGVADARHVAPDGGHHDDDAADDAPRPPIRRPDPRRICASLCMGGLGGKPCGGSCMAIQPQDFPVQFVNGSDGGVVDVDGDGPKMPVVKTPFPRRDACPLLCKFHLGDPLCDCPPQMTSFDSIFFDIDFGQICGFYCTRQAYRIYGCPACDVYESFAPEVYAIGKRPKTNIDWDSWCREMCGVGDGGVACNCDILPLSLPFDDKNHPQEH